MNKRTLLAIVLMFLTYWLFNAYFFPKQQEPTPQESTRSVESETKEVISKPKINLTNDMILISSDYPDAQIRYNFTATEPTINDDLYQGPIQLDDPDQIYKLRAKVFYNEQESALAFYTTDLIRSDIIQASDTEEVYLKSEKLSLVLSPIDGLITQAYINDYQMGDKKVQLIPANTGIGHIEIADVNLKDLIYFKEVTKNSVKFYLKDTDNQIIFAKEYILNDNYQVDFKVYFTSSSYRKDYLINSPGIADTENLIYKETHPEKYFKTKSQDYKLIALDNNTILSETLAKLQSNKVSSESNSVKWVASRSKYFVISLFSDKIIADKKFEGEMKNQSPAFKLMVEDSEFQNEFEHYYMYLGPVDKDYIEAYDQSLIFDRVIERSWTWLHWLSKLFEIVLQGLGKVIPNYGIVIIIFAFLIKLVFYPLTHKSFENSIKMQQVQPYLTEIQKKYKSDPMKMQKEMSKIKKEHGVSTLGGCLPMLIQMPIFFALYPALRYSIALRGASFGGWLQDLSNPDPYYILPIIMGIFMFIQQRMMTSLQMQNSANMDEKQQQWMQSQKMMAYILPVMMFFFFRNLPSGLVLYWTVFNILSIVQQHFINKKFRGQ
ncbi:membrane protein insertase YidC [bacterium]|nr:membrane protein insertase YidC [bacterium]